jgi:hypothetical protein
MDPKSDSFPYKKKRRHRDSEKRIKNRDWSAAKARKVTKSSHH